ncbi:bacterial extracellular solute-binding family protein [Paraburkholderia fungorum]|uniref:Bacterial extracellular solute-binding family protein n=3 Tax=Paraburkholderia fungorum TaxID=134537 RepID=A0AAU8ST38_9BURK|nr:class II aldolase/adducin family protein [Paraburkholderia fungorum]AJZ56532.1 bacterial extracellular solute-binding family protein [Paraburkholderia fungorum]
MSDLITNTLKAWRFLYRRGFIEGFGHISVRLPGERFMITRHSLGMNATAEDFVIMDLEGRKLEGAGDPPGEYPIHLEVLAARPDVNCVIHYHGMYSTAFTTSGQRLRPIHLMGTLFHDGIPTYDDPRLVSDRTRGAYLAKALGKHRAVLMCAHGATVTGASVEEAVASAFLFEENAHRACVSATLGAPVWIDDETAVSAGTELIKTRGPFRRVWALVEAEDAQTELIDVRTPSLAAPAARSAAAQSSETDDADTFRVMTSGVFTAAYLALVPALEALTGKKVVTVTTSIGTGAESIPNRLERFEPVDLVIVAEPNMQQFLDAGYVLSDSSRLIAQSTVAVAVRDGAPAPDVSCAEALRRTFLAARTIAYSASASGRYLTTQLYQKLGIAEQCLPKSRFVGGGERTGAIVARGEADLAFQQVSELRPVAGIAHITPLPADLQLATRVAVGIPAWSRNEGLARCVIRYLESAASADAIVESGLEPLGSGAQTVQPVLAAVMDTGAAMPVQRPASSFESRSGQAAR